MTITTAQITSALEAIAEIRHHGVAHARHFPVWEWLDDALQSGAVVLTTPQMDAAVADRHIRIALEDLNLHCTDHAPDPDCEGCRTQLSGFRFLDEVEPTPTGATPSVTEALSLAKQATNGWACFARTGIEHDVITRLHQNIDALIAAAGDAHSKKRV